MSRQRGGRSPHSFDEILKRGAQRHRAGDVAGAASIYEGVLRDAPDHAEALRLLSLAARDLGQLDRAVELATRASSVAPGAARMHAALGEALAAAGRGRDAIAALERALAISKDVGVMALLGSILAAERDFAGAERWLGEALRSAPNHAPSLFHMATLARQTGRPALAQRHLERFLATGANAAVAWTNLGTALQDQGLVDRAIDAFRHALALDAGAHDAYGNLLQALLLSDRTTPKQAFEEHVRRGLWLAQTVGQVELPRTDARDRPLRVGYLSPDLREHPVATFLEPVLRHHDAARVHVVCYQDSTISDAVTARLRPLAKEWREVASMSDAALAQRIRDDRIDVLVDLAVNSGGNRQPLFARRAAPLQITWLGYAATTGLPTMDYRLTDATVDPPGTTEKLHTERLLRLPDVLWCYAPPEDAPDIGARAPGPPRFASPSRLAKISDRTLDAWCAILRALPDATLMLQAGALAEPAVREAWSRRFADRGVDPARVELQGAMPMHAYLARLGEADVVLDTFPFCGGTTACHALWMGAPVVTLAETAPWSRVTASVLGSVGLGHLVARDVDDYVAKAVATMRDEAARAELRRTARERMRASPLLDAPRFTRALEDAYRKAWEKR